jgi:hypothetical protein
LRAISATFIRKSSVLRLVRDTAYCARNEHRVYLSPSVTTGGLEMLKVVIVGTASLALVGTAVAADIPRPQPVAQNAPIGKYPVGKYPVGKTPVGKYPAAPVVTKG